MNPPKGNWLYFVAIDKEGHSASRSTYDEHEREHQKAATLRLLIRGAVTA